MTLVSAEFDVVKVWDLRTGRSQALSGHGLGLECVCPLTATTLVGCGLGGLQVWDVTAMRCTDAFHYSNNAPPSRRSVRVVTPRTVVSGGSSGADLWDLPTRRKSRDLRGHVGEVLDVCALAPATVATAGKDKSVKVWDCSTGSCSQTLLGHVEGVYSICALSSSTLATGSRDSTVKLLGS